MKNKIKSRGNISYDLSTNKSYNNPNTYGGLSDLLTKADSALQVGAPYIQSGLTTLSSALSNADIKKVNPENPIQMGTANNADDFINNWNNIDFAKTDYEKSDFTKPIGEQVGNILSAGVSAGLNTKSPWATIGAMGLAGVGSLIGNQRAKTQAQELNKKNNQVNIDAINKGSAIFDNIASNNTFNMEKNLASLGGNLFNRGANYDSGLMLINEGGTHESNPNSGIQLGTDEQGVPNLVEQGEVVYNDYVFSNRLYLTEQELRDNYLPTSLKDTTFAYAAEKIGKNLIETPTDTLERNKVDNFLRRLANIQEAQRAKMGKVGTQQMAYGGNKFSGKENKPNTFLGSMPNPNTLMSNFNSQISKYNNITPPTNPSTSVNLTPKLQGVSDFKLPTFTPKPFKTDEELIDERTNINAKRNATLRRVPIYTNMALGLASLLQKPDYTNAELLEKRAREIPNNTVSPTYLNDYMTYTPIDRNYYLNQLKGQAGATRNAIMNSGSNAGTAMANLLASDYNSQNAVANSLMQMEQFNRQQKQAVSDFNRGTNQFNSQVGMQSNQANAQLALNRAKLQNTLLAQAAQYREGADTALLQSQNKAIQDIGTQIGLLGREGTDNNVINYLAPLLAPGYQNLFSAYGGKIKTKKSKK